MLQHLQEYFGDVREDGWLLVRAICGHRVVLLRAADTAAASAASAEAKQRCPMQGC